MVEEPAVFGLDAQGAIEVAGNPGDEAGCDGLIFLVIDVAVDRVKVAISSVDIEPRWARQAGAGGCRLCRGEQRNGDEGCKQQNGALHQVTTKAHQYSLKPQCCKFLPRWTHKESTELLPCPAHGLTPCA